MQVAMSSTSQSPRHHPHALQHVSAAPNTSLSPPCMPYLLPASPFIASSSFQRPQHTPRHSQHALVTLIASSNPLSSPVYPCPTCLIPGISVVLLGLQVHPHLVLLRSLHVLIAASLLLSRAVVPRVSLSHSHILGAPSVTLSLLVCIAASGVSTSCALHPAAF
ncbi:hypothetical protein EVG20_g6908 [Dentipellis fragilis]|uniref:Uncharacterized protein n=1 Tax=Dentipellis fragilis TaxID=205917 RepID=A0A4Y9YIK1_9AGAM|nr:hypothetical protein EVG20_g6908 [Dentipellis fragilis]